MKKLVALSIFISIISICTIGAVQPQLQFNDSRVMGLGNTFTAVADDKNLLFYNPAGLANYGKKKTSLHQAFFNPSEWKPRYRNIGELTVTSAELRLYNNLSQDYFDAVQTLLDLGVIPVDLGTINNTIGSYNQFYSLSPIIRGILGLPKLRAVDSNATNLGWGNLSYSQLSNMNSALNVLSQSAVSFSLDASLLTYINRHFGFGIFSSSDLSMVFGIQGFLPDIRTKIRQDLMMLASYGMNWPGMKRLSVGTTVKLFHRMYINLETTEDYLQYALFSEENPGFQEPLLQQAIKHPVRSALTGLTLDTQLPETMSLGTGLGFDLGAMYRLKHNINVGLQLSDVYTRIRMWDGKRSEFIPINARAGIAWKPDISLWGLFEDPLLAFDVDDLFFQQNRNFWMKVHAGAEFKMLFKILHFRMGINQGYFTYGGGLDLSLYVLSKLPVLKWLRPDSIYLPRFNPNKKDFLEKNFCCCLLTGALAAVTYAHIKLDVLSYTRELGPYAGAIPDRQLSLRLSLSYSY